MSDWLDDQKEQSSNIRKLLHARIEKANPRRELTAEESKRLNKLEGKLTNLNVEKTCKPVSCKRG